MHANLQNTNTWHALILFLITPHLHLSLSDAVKSFTQRCVIFDGNYQNDN